ncbi:MAG TPA: HlyC/CorC family transporter [Synergistaceae bacterium]|nr:HlyC/CorC family transporter [Synergistaceae bacterium]
MTILFAKHLIAIVLLLLLSAFFSAADTAISSSGKGKILALIEKYPYKRSALNWLLADVQKVLTVLLLLNTLVNIAAGSVAAALALSVWGVKGLVLSVPVIVLVVVIFGEIFPKSVAMVNVETTLIISLPFLRILSLLATPFVWFALAVVRLLGLVFRTDISVRHPFVTREEFEHMVNIGGESGALEEVEQQMIHGIISFEETRVYEIMVPRTDMKAVPSSLTISDAIRVCQENGHSRVPVYGENLDDILGILYVKDTLFHFINGDMTRPVTEVMREPLFVPESMRVVELFNTMKGRHVHLAVVVDEYGGVAGILTLEDLLEEIVGEIQDEYDEEKPTLQAQEDGSFLVQAQIGLEDLSDLLDSPFESEDAETLAGLVLSLSGDFPAQGDRILYEPRDGGRRWSIEVLEVEDHRIKLLRLRESGSEYSASGEGE